MARRQHKVKTTPSSLPALNTDTYPGPQSLTGLTVCVSAAEVPAANTPGSGGRNPPRFYFRHLEPLSTYHKFLSLGSRAVFLLSRSLLSLSSFHQRWQQNCGPHSALINSLHEEDHQTCKPAPLTHARSEGSLSFCFSIASSLSVCPPEGRACAEGLHG